jgi:hypothetical protein
VCWRDRERGETDRRGDVTGAHQPITA